MPKRTDIEKILISSEKVSKRGSKIEQLEFEDEERGSVAYEKPAPPKLAAGE